MHIQALEYTTESADFFNKIQHLSGSVWLDSGKPQSQFGRYCILSALPEKVINTSIESLDVHLRPELEAASDINELPFCGGWIGFIDYNSNARFGWYNWAIIIDHHQQLAKLVWRDSCPKKTIGTIISLINAAQPIIDSMHCATFVADQPKANYMAAIAKIHEYLRTGDCYQVNYTQRFSADFRGSAYSAYLKLRKAVPSPFSAYLNLGNEQILSISPERFIQVCGRAAVTQPIKGTAARSLDPSEDEAAKVELYNSEKNRAENIMIVDLLRNDFNKNSALFSVEVPKLFEVQSFNNVHHLVSTITGKLRPEISHPAFIADCFPGGSITGAPKIRAMQIIDELEPHDRDIYCGSIGYFSCNGNSDFNIAIRTLKVTNGKAYAWAGGGIVLDSDPEQEYEESLAKIGAFLRAIEN